MKIVLHICVSENQSAFVPRRSILDNVMATIEVVHHIKAKMKDKVGDIALNLDISKAYDMIDLNYLREVLITMGSNQRWVKWIMLCMETVDYYVN